MDASEFEELMYKIIQEKLFKDQTIKINNKNKEITSWLVSEYTILYFGIEILDTFTCQSRHHKKEPKSTVDDKLIMSFDGISPKNGNLNISNQKYSK